MSRSDDAAATVIMAFVLGAVTGAAVALLMAPAREGRERANEAARQGRDFVSRQKETLSSAIDRGREAYEQARAGGPNPATGGGDNL
jgi:hypothetical protein